MDSFRACHRISVTCISRESGSVDIDCASSWRDDRLPRLLAGYSTNDVFNAEESSLFYKMRPGKTMSSNSDTCHGGKRSKERISILFCCNMSGTEKESLFMIGKAKRHKCFSHWKHIPVTYEAIQNARMTSSIFNSW